MGVSTTAGEADHVIHLDLTAGAHAQIALDAGIHIYRDGWMAAVRGRGLLCRKAGCGNILAVGIAP